MIAPRIRAFRFCPLLLLAACSSGSAGSSAPNGNLGNSRDDGGGETDESVSDGGIQVGDPTSLEGVWDVTGSSDGKNASSGVITIDSKNLVIVFGQTTLEFHANGGALTTRYVQKSNMTNVATTRASGSMGLGIFPLSLGGEWSFSESGKVCSANLSPLALSGSCNTNLNGSGLSFLPQTKGSVTGTKKSSGASWFGDLGGAWTFALSSGKSCEASFLGNVVDVNCRGTIGTLHAVVANDMISGTNSAGMEFTAIRR